MSAVAHLQKDPIFKKLIQQIGEDISHPWGKDEADYFSDLIEIVVGQQLSIKAANSIFERLKELLNQNVDPRKIVRVRVTSLRKIGLSNAKAVYVKNVAQARLAGELDFENFEKYSDEEIVQKLVAIKGLGDWSAEMFLIFSLRRPDVFSIGDLGLRTAVSNLYAVDRDDRQKILDIAERWRPHRSLASRYLWKSLEST